MARRYCTVMATTPAMAWAMTIPAPMSATACCPMVMPVSTTAVPRLWA